jgi:hypothetical protein
VANFRNMMVDAAEGTNMQGELALAGIPDLLSREQRGAFPDGSVPDGPRRLDWAGPQANRSGRADGRHSWVNSSTMLGWHQARDCGSMNRPRETEDARPALSY